MTDERFDKLLKEAVNEAVILETGEIKKGSRGFFYKPSREFEEKMERLFQRSEGGGGEIRNVKWEQPVENCQEPDSDASLQPDKTIKKNRTDKRVRFKGRGRLFILAAAIAMLMCASVLASDKIQLLRSQLTVKNTEGGLNITVDENKKNGAAVKENSEKTDAVKEDDQDSGATDFGVKGIYRISWIPQGFAQTEESGPDKDNPYWHSETFENKKTGDMITYWQMPDSYEINLGFDQKNGVQESVNISGIEGKYFSDGETKEIVYEADGLMYMIRGSVSKHKLVKMLESRVRTEEQTGEN